LQLTPHAQDAAPAQIDLAQQLTVPLASPTNTRRLLAIHAARAQPTCTPKTQLGHLIAAVVPRSQFGLAKNIIVTHAGQARFGKITLSSALAAHSAVFFRFRILHQINACRVKVPTQSLAPVFA